MTVAIRPRSQSHYKQPIKKKDTLDHLRTNFIAKKKIQLHFQFLPFELTYSWNRSIQLTRLLNRTGTILATKSGTIWETSPLLEIMRF